MPFMQFEWKGYTGEEYNEYIFWETKTLEKEKEKLIRTNEFGVKIYWNI